MKKALFFLPLFFLVSCACNQQQTEDNDQNKSGQQVPMPSGQGNGKCCPRCPGK